MSQREDTRDQLRIEAQENPDQAGFLQEAATISNDYQTRLHPVLKERLKGEVFFDVHAHCFNHVQVPNNFLRTRMNTPYDIMGTWFVKGLAKIVGLFSPNVAVLSIAAYRKPELIAQTLIKCYHKVFKVSKQPDRHVVVVMLSLNMEYGIGEGVREPFLPDKNDPKKGSQVESLINTCNYFIDHRKGKKANGSIIPYICIDPNRHDAYRIFLEAFARAKYNYPFFGVKVYPCLGYLPNHPVLMDIFKVCEEKNIPVLTHCGGTTTRTDADSVWIAEWRKNAEPETYNQAFERAKGDDKEHAYEEFFLAPKRWLPVLEEYPNLRLNIAHLGSDRQWENYLKGGLQNEMKGNFVHQTLQIIQKYPNVYADISYSLAADANLRCIQQLMLDHPEIKRKLLFGSDYYVLLKAQKIKGAVKDFYEIFGNTPELIQALTVDNPKRHLFA